MTVGVHFPRTVYSLSEIMKCWANGSRAMTYSIDFLTLGFLRVTLWFRVRFMVRIKVQFRVKF